MRKDDPDCARLVKRARGTALRCPEKPDVTYWISVADIRVDDILEAWARVPLAAHAF